MTKKLNIAVIGATGLVGSKIIQILSENLENYGEVFAVASKNSSNKKISYGDDKILNVKEIENFNFSKTDISIFAVSSEISARYIPKALDSGNYVIDKSSFFRLKEDIPLIVPEVNGNLVTKETKLYSSPNCCVTPLSVILNPLNNFSKIKRVVLSTYQSVSGAGKSAMDELYNQTKSTYMYQDIKTDAFERRIAFNLIPKIDDLEDDGRSLEEEKIRLETKKMFNNQFDLSVTSVRVPVFVGHCLSVNVEFSSKISVEDAEELLYESDGVSLIAQKSEKKYVTPFEIAGEDSVYVSRIRNDPSKENSLNMWIVSDNLRKGAATNSVQILELISSILKN